MKRLLALALVTLVVVAVVGCDDDPAKPKKTSPYKNLSEPWHVLFNLELAYDNKNIDRYCDLLDPDNFVFFFDSGDSGGYFPPSGQWGYAEDVQSARNMFNSAPGINDNPILTIELTLFDVENVQWAETTSPDFPGESLRMAVVEYDFYIDTADDRQFITSGNPTIQVTVRSIDGKWKLVEWSDLSNGLLLRTAASTEEATWGKVKALYQ